MRDINLIFQGGGIKGAAYAHVLDHKPDDVRIRGVGGTSAGAVVAALIAVGMAPRELASVLATTDFSRLIDANDLARFKRLSDAATRLRALFARFAAGKRRRSLLEAAAWLNGCAESLVRDVKTNLASRGMCSTAPLRDWLKQHLGERTFDDATAVGDLRIVAANVSDRRYRVYSKKRNGGTKIVDAVVASASIPLFFWPYTEGGDTLVDGGILSNFPSFLFAQDEAPSIGFRLVDFAPPADLSHPFRYLSGLLLTMAEAHDAHRELPKNFFEYRIPVPGMAATKFGLSQQELTLLAESGRAIGEAVNWNPQPASSRRSAHYDPRPLAALDMCFSEGSKIAPLLSAAGVRPDKLTEHVTFIVWIEQSLEGFYESEHSLEVEGGRPLIALPFGIATTDASLPQALQSPSSICDIQLEMSEMRPGGKVRLAALPVDSTPTRKQFVAFFDPAVLPGSGARTVVARWRTADDFRNAFDTGVPDGIHYSSRRWADTHALKVQLRINLAKELPFPEFLDDHRDLTQQDASIVRRGDGREFYSVTADFDQLEVQGHASPRFAIRFRWEK